MENTNNRKNEWTDQQCDDFAAFDAAREPKEFLPQIYREANNAVQDPDARIAKTLMKCSALFIRLSADQDKRASLLEKLTKRLLAYTLALLALTFVIACLTIYLCYREHQASHDVNQANQTTQQTIKHP